MASITDLKAVLRPASAITPVDKLAAEFSAQFERWLLTTYPAYQRERAPGLHASSLWKTCARRRVLEHIHNVPPEVNAAGNWLTYDVGHALHYWWQNNYLGPMGILIGNWRCLACNAVVATDAPQPEVCPTCKRDRRDVLEYEEYHVYDPDLNFQGHSDGVIELGGRRHVFEFKTASPSEFSMLTKPKLEHVVQAHAYMRTLKLTTTLIVYQNKGQQCAWSKAGGRWRAGKLNTKVFLIEFDNTLWDRFGVRCREYHEADAMVRRLPVVTDAQAKSFERLCTSPQCHLAEDCPVAVPCFALT